MAIEIVDSFAHGVTADAVVIRDEELFRPGLFQKKKIYTARYNHKKYRRLSFEGKFGKYKYCIHISPERYSENNLLSGGNFYSGIIAEAQRKGFTSIALPQFVKYHHMTECVLLFKELESILPEEMTVYLFGSQYELLYNEYPERKYIGKYIYDYYNEPEDTGIRYSLKVGENSEKRPDRGEEQAKKPEAIQLPLEEYIALVHTGFSTVLFRFIDSSGMDDVTVYKKANIHRRTFSRIRTDKDYQPSKNTVFALALALELDYKQTSQLLASAGYAFSHSSKTDIIVEYHICNRIFDIHTVNYALFSFGEKTLGM